MSHTLLVKVCKWRNLLDKRCAFVLLNFSNETLNIHSCSFHQHASSSLMNSIKNSNLLINKRKGCSCQRKCSQQSKIESNGVTCWKWTRWTSLNQNALHFWIHLPFIEKVLVLYVHLYIIMQIICYNKFIPSSSRHGWSNWKVGNGTIKHWTL